jgi:hypothetical protein
VSGAELAARMTAAAAVLGDYRADLASAPLMHPPPMAVWAQRLSRALDDIIRAPGGCLTDGQREVLGHALADAIENNERGLDDFCAGCDRHPSALCAGHAADLDRADSYRALARTLGIEVPR